MIEKVLTISLKNKESSPENKKLRKIIISGTIK